MNSLDAALQQDLEQIRAAALYRQLRRVDSPQTTKVQIAGRTLLNFSSNDYLGLANDLRLKEAALKAVQRFGAGSGASRLICGSLGCHHELEDALASFKGTAAAVAFSSGFAAAVGTISSVIGRDDILIIDKLVHACIVDAAKLCQARLRVYEHNDLNDLEDILKWARSRADAGATTRASRILIATESVFSMDGDQSPLLEIIALKERYGAWLMVDEAHSTGLYGPTGRGLADELGVSSGVDIHMGTLGKALGSAGGFICGSRPLADILVNRARTFIFSTAPVPAAAGAASAGVECVLSAEGAARRDRLWDVASRIQHASVAERTALARAQRSAILPVLIGDEEHAMKAAATLHEKGIFVPAVRFPTVPRNQARLRVTLTAAHSHADVEELNAAIQTLGLI